MQRDEFERVLEDELSYIKYVLTEKGREYSPHSDAFHNFRVAARLRDCTIPEAITGMMAKHTVSIFDLAVSPFEHDMRLWTEKITDHINYLLLLKISLLDHQRSLAVNGSDNYDA